MSKDKTIQEWQLIKTAPKYEVILIAKLDQDYPNIWLWLHVAEWIDGWGLVFDSAVDDGLGTPYLDEDDQPTHWMPLPKPPKTTRGKQND